MAQIVIDSGPFKGKPIRLEGKERYTGGRDAKNDICLKDPLVSRQHFRIEIHKNQFRIKDLGSVNGTLLNGARVPHQKTILNGDRIQAGETTLVFYEDEIDDPLVGRTISGFEVLERVGTGGMGTVYKARQISLDRVVALKVLSKELAADRKFTELFHREARAAGQINHPSIVQVYDVDTVRVGDEDVTFFAMEYMPGGSVEDLIGQQKQLGVDQVVQIALDTARGIQFAEKRGIVHRDIKPGNLMVSETGMIKIGDLGIARSAENGNKVSQREGVSGSPHYIAPEQAKGLDLDSGADIYSLGITMYHALAGRPPFVGSTAKELVLKHLKEDPPPMTDFRADLPLPLVLLIERMIRKERAERFPDATALVEAIETLQADLRALGAVPPRSRLVVVKRALARARPFLLPLLVVLALGSAGGIIVHEVQKSKAEAAERLKNLRSDLQEAFTQVALALEDGDAAGARSIFEQLVRPRLSPSPSVASQIEELLAQARTLRERIEAAERQVEANRRENEASKELDSILRNTPDDLLSLESYATLPALLDALEDFEERHAGTGAAKRAGEVHDRVLEALRTTQARLRSAETAFNALESQVNTLVSLGNYSDALRSIADFPSQHPDTPEVGLAEALARRVRDDMLRTTRERIESARQAASQGNDTEAIRQLERLRPGVTGEALVALDEALAELRQ